MKFKFTLRSIPVVEKIFFVQNLSLMIKTGFSIGDALRTLSQQIKNKQFRLTVQGLEASTQQGESFAAALAHFPDVFDELFVNMVAAGETSGNLEKTLQQLSVQMKKSYSLHKKIRNAMIYPCLIITVMITVGSGMFIFVVPRILELYTTNGYNLPLPTKIIMAISSFISNNGLVLGVSIVCLITGWILVLRTEAGKLAWHRVLLRIPIAGKIIKHIQLARLSRVLNSLIITDVSIVKSFTIVANTLSNRVYRNHLLNASLLLSKGDSIFSILNARPDLFDPVIAQMIKIGEESGTLDVMTNEIAGFFEEEVDSTMSNLTVIIEPVLMVIIGAGVGFLAVAIVMPIYSLVDEI
ncbi:MAG: type II secretion system F family protein [Patescibacteria group bacterium]